MSTTVTSFKDLGIKAPERKYVGPSLKMSKLFNRIIKVLYYKIEPSDFPEKGNGKRLVLQLELDGKLHIVFTNSVSLQNTIQQVPPDKFPIETTIVEEDETFYFT